MPENAHSGQPSDPTTHIINKIIETMTGVNPMAPTAPPTEASTNTSNRPHVEERLRALLYVTSADTAYDIIDGAFAPPPKAKGEALATWNYHAERTRRQMVGAVLGEKAMALATERLSQHFDTYGSVVVPTTREHPIRSASLQNFVSTMNHWFTDIVAEVAREDPTGRALVEAGNRRWPLFRQAVINWLEHRHRRGKNLDWQVPNAEANTIKDITAAYGLNMASEVPTEFLLFGQDIDHTGANPAALAHARLPYLGALTSTGVGVSAPILKPFAAYDPETGVNEDHRDSPTPQALYSAWEHNPTPENARAFLALAEDPNVRANLERAGALPGAGEDGRSVNPGHCHVDMRIVGEEDFAVPPRELLLKLGEEDLAHTEYLNVTTLISAVGYHAAADTLYKQWPEQPEPRQQSLDAAIIKDMPEDFPHANNVTENLPGQPGQYKAGNGDTLTPPPGFKYDPNIMSTYDEQLQDAVARHQYQLAPLPSFEHTPRVDITPVFNPSGAPGEEIYARNRAPEKLGSGLGLHSGFGHTEPVDIWRIVSRERLADGTGLVSSQILAHNTLGDIERFDEGDHLSTEHADRMEAGRETPFVSFVTDPTGLAKTYILEMGFGIGGDRDSVVVRARVDPTRVITTGLNKEEAVALIGGVAPDEYVEAYEVSDFVKAAVPESATFYGIDDSGKPLSRDEALNHWQKRNA